MSNDEKIVELTQEDLESVAGGGILNRVPKVKENDYDEEVEDKAGSGQP